MEPNIVNKISISKSEFPKVELKGVNFSQFTHRQIIALIKSAFYLIAADDCYTSEEMSVYRALCSVANITNPQHSFEEAKVMDLDEMFTSLRSMSKAHKETVLFWWIQCMQASKDDPLFLYQKTTGLFDLDSYPNEKPWLIDMATRCNIDISAFLNGAVKLL